MNYILNSLRVLRDDVVGKDGEVRFSVRDESETIIRQGVHTISDSGEITTVSTLLNLPPRPAAAASKRPSVSPQQGSPSTTRASRIARQKPDTPEVIVIDDSSDDERSSGYDSDTEEKSEENAHVIPICKPQQNAVGPVKQEPVSIKNEPVVLMRKHAKQEPEYIEIKDEDTESE